jgi:hypothetical protein
MAILEVGGEVLEPAAKILIYTPDISPALHLIYTAALEVGWEVLELARWDRSTCRDCRSIAKPVAKDQAASDRIEGLRRKAKQGESGRFLRTPADVWGPYHQSRLPMVMRNMAMKARAKVENSLGALSQKKETPMIESVGGAKFPANDLLWRGKRAEVDARKRAGGGG